MKQALEAYKAHLATEKAAPGAVPTDPAAKAQSRQAFIADTAKRTGLTEAELSEAFARYDRPGGPGLQPHELDALAARAAEVPAPEHHGVLGWVASTVQAAGHLADRAVDAAGDAAKEALHTVGEGTGYVLDATGHAGAARDVRSALDHAGRVASQDAHAAGRTIENVATIGGELIRGDTVAAANDVAQRVLGPEKPGHEHELGGALGAVTNRLAPGDAVFLSGMAKVTLPSQTVAAIFTLGAGSAVPDLVGSLAATGMVTRNTDGRLTLTLDVKSTEGAEWEAGLGVTGGVTLGSHRYGVDAGVKVGAGVEASQSMKLNLTFDPKKPEDMARLQALVGPSGADANNPVSFGLAEGQALSDALKHNLASTEIGGGFQAKVGLKLAPKVGEIKPDAGSEAASKPTLNFGELGLKAGVGGSMSVSRNFENKTTTATINLEAGVDAKAKLPFYGGGGGKGGLKFADTFAVTRDDHGRIVGMAASTALAADGTPRKDAGQFGANDVRPWAGVGESRKATEVTKLTPAGMKAANDLIAKGVAPPDAFREVSQHPGLTTTSRTTIEANSFALGADFSANLGVGKVKVEAMVAIGTSHSTTATVDDPTQRDLDTMTGH